MKTKRPKKHTFNGKPYELVWRVYSKKERGRCADPKNKPKNRKLYVSLKQTPKDVAETLIHEALHAELWCLEEDTVQRVAEEINDLLWKCGFELKTLPSQSAQQ